MKKHILDKFILRDFFWFIVIPYNFKIWKKAQVKDKV